MKVTKEWVKGVLDANGDGTITKDQDVLGQAEYFWILRAGPSQKYIYIYIYFLRCSRRGPQKELGQDS